MQNITFLKKKSRLLLLFCTGRGLGTQDIREHCFDWQVIYFFYLPDLCEISFFKACNYNTAEKERT